jgi:hypothetical protein
MSFKPKKVKVVEVLSLHCLDREPRPGFPYNRWVARVKTEPSDAVLIVRTVTIQAKDELEAFTKLLTEGV